MAVVPELNYVAILVAAVVYFLLGWAWYSDALFGKPWRKLNGLSGKAVDAKRKNGMAGLLVTNFITILVTCYILANMLAFLATGSLSESMQVVAWTWLGFSAAVTLPGYLYTGKSVQLFVLDLAYHLIGLLVATAIIFSMA